MVTRRQIERGQNSAVHRNEVRCKLDYYPRAGRQREFLLNLGKVPVLGDAVRADALVALNEEIVNFGLSAGAADPAERIGNDLGRLYQTSPEQWYCRHENAGA